MREKQAEDLPIISENAKLHHQKYQERRLKLKSLTSWSERKLFFKEQKELESKKVEQNTHPTLNLILKGEYKILMSIYIYIDYTQKILSLNLILGDVNGSLEVLLEILTTYDQEEECHMCIVDASVGNVTQSDLEIAETFNGKLVTHLDALL